MTHPIFARLDDEVRLVEREFANLVASNEKSTALRERAPDLYGEWTHRAALAEGMRAVYKGLEDVMRAIANEIDGYDPSKGPNGHEALVKQMAAGIGGIRGPFLGPELVPLIHELRQFRHKVHHGYAQHWELARLQENLARCEEAVPLFRKAYDDLARRMQEAPGDRGGGGS